MTAWVKPIRKWARAMIVRDARSVGGSSAASSYKSSAFL